MDLIWLVAAALILTVMLLCTFIYGRILLGVCAPVKKPDPELANLLQKHVYILSHQIGIRDVNNYDKLREAAQYITRKFRESGYEVEFQHYEAHGKTVKNIIAAKPGTAKPEEVITIGAHYDSFDNPGADDNASGIAALIETAKLSAGAPTRRSIEFVAFVNEEPPFFHTEEMGSRVYTKLAKKAGKNIRAGLILEMLGYYSEKPDSQCYPAHLTSLYPNQANFIAVVGNRASHPLAIRVAASFKQNSSIPVEIIPADAVPEGDYSDHWSFWQEGYSAVMLTDTSFYRYIHYHQAGDTYDKLNYHAMGEVVKGLDAVIKELAN